MIVFSHCTVSPMSRDGEIRRIHWRNTENTLEKYGEYTEEIRRKDQGRRKDGKKERGKDQGRRKEKKEGKEERSRKEERRKEGKEERRTG